MSDKKQDLDEKLKTLSYDDLVGYERAAVILSRLVGFAGVAFILLAMSFPGVLTVIGCTLIVILLSVISSGVDESIDLIRDALSRKSTKS